MKKLDGCKTYSVILNEQELNICRSTIQKLDIRNIDLNVSSMLRYLVRVGIYCSDDLYLDAEKKDLLRNDF